MISGQENSAVWDFFFFVLYLNSSSPSLLVSETTSNSQKNDPRLIAEITSFDCKDPSFKRLDLSP